MKKCMRCHSLNPDDATYCQNCGDDMTIDETKVFVNKVSDPKYLDKNYDPRKEREAKYNPLTIIYHLFYILYVVLIIALVFSNNIYNFSYLILGFILFFIILTISIGVYSKNKNIKIKISKYILFTILSVLILIIALTFMTYYRSIISTLLR